MLYEELKRLTNGEATVKEYEIVNHTYMACEDMTKEGAADLWKYLFGKKHRDKKREKARVNAQCHDLEWVLDFIGDDSGDILLPNGDMLNVVRNYFDDKIDTIYLVDARLGTRAIAVQDNRGGLVPVQKRYFRK